MKSSEFIEEFKKKNIIEIPPEGLEDKEIIAITRTEDALAPSLIAGIGIDFENGSKEFYIPQKIRPAKVIMGYIKGLPRKIVIKNDKRKLEKYELGWVYPREEEGPPFGKHVLFGEVKMTYIRKGINPIENILRKITKNYDKLG
jgi:hypothetical protein